MAGGMERALGGVSLHCGLPETTELCFQSLSLEDLGSPHPSLGQPLASQEL